MALVRPEYQLERTVPPTDPALAREAETKTAISRLAIQLDRIEMKVDDLLARDPAYPREYDPVA